MDVGEVVGIKDVPKLLGMIYLSRPEEHFLKMDDLENAQKTFAAASRMLQIEQSVSPALFLVNGHLKSTLLRHKVYSLPRRIYMLAIGEPEWHDGQDALVPIAGGSSYRQAPRDQPLHPYTPSKTQIGSTRFFRVRLRLRGGWEDGGGAGMGSGGVVWLVGGICRPEVMDDLFSIANQGPDLDDVIFFEVINAKPEQRVLVSAPHLGDYGARVASRISHTRPSRSRALGGEGMRSPWCLRFPHPLFQEPLSDCGRNLRSRRSEWLSLPLSRSSCSAREPGFDPCGRRYPPEANDRRW